MPGAARGKEEPGAAAAAGSSTKVAVGAGTRSIGPRAAAAAAAVVHVSTVAATGAVAALLLHRGSDSTAVGRYADATNLAAGVLQVLSWMPQIVYTYRLKDVGSLSLTLSVQAPGSGGAVVAMIASGQRWSSVAQYAAAFVCIAVLFVECVYYVARQCPEGESRCRWVLRRGFCPSCYPADADPPPCTGGMDGGPGRTPSPP